MPQTIGFFGDSFCANESNSHSVAYGYKTYIELLKDHYNSKIVHLGKEGSSIYDVVLMQLEPFLRENKFPDVCVFCWTNSGRLYHPRVRNINFASASSYKSGINDNLDSIDSIDSIVWQAAQMYYNHLHDHRKEFLEYRSLLAYIDQCFLPDFPSTTKVIHLWSMGHSNWNDNNFNPNAINYPHTWTHGSEIRPALLSLSLYDNQKEILGVDPRCNHLDGQLKNKLVFSWIQQAIDNPKKIWDHSNFVNDLYSTHS